MKSQTQWFNEYAESHQNSSNQHIHYICVSLIFFSIVGILTSIDNPRLQNIYRDVYFIGYSTPW